MLAEHARSGPNLPHRCQVRTVFDGGSATQHGVTAALAKAGHAKDRESLVFWRFD